MKPGIPIPAILIPVLAGLLAWVILGWQPTAPEAVPSPVEDAAPSPPAAAAALMDDDVTLQSARGPLRLADLRGRVVLLYFGYTWCPDICPTNLVFIANALRLLTDAERARVQAIFVSLDPERDDPRRLQTYGAYFHPDILGVTGTPEQLAALAARHGVVYHRMPAPDSAMGYLIDHSAYTYLLAPDGRLVRTLDHATASPEIARAIRSLLAPAPAAL